MFCHHLDSEKLKHELKISKVAQRNLIMKAAESNKNEVVRIKHMLIKEEEKKQEGSGSESTT